MGYCVRCRGACQSGLNPREGGDVLEMENVPVVLSIPIIVVHRLPGTWYAAVDVQASLTVPSPRASDLFPAQLSPQSPPLRRQSRSAARRAVVSDAERHPGFEGITGDLSSLSGSHDHHRIDGRGTFHGPSFRMAVPDVRGGDRPCHRRQSERARRADTERRASAGLADGVGQQCQAQADEHMKPVSCAIVDTSTNLGVRKKGDPAPCRPISSHAPS